MPSIFGERAGYPPQWKVGSAANYRTKNPRERSSRDVLIEILLKAGEDLTNFRRVSEVSHRNGNRVVVFELQLGCEFVLIEFFHADLHIMRQHKIEEDLLFRVEMRADLHLCFGGAIFACERRQCVRDIGEHVE